MNDLDELFRRDPLGLSKDRDLAKIVAGQRKKMLLDKLRKRRGNKEISDTELSILQLDLFDRE